MTHEAFVQLVKRMRSAQKRYRDIHLPGARQECLRLESECDIALESIACRLQPGLFDDAPKNQQQAP